MVSQQPNIMEWLQPLVLMTVIGLLLLLILKQTMELSRRERLMKARRVYTVVACGDKVEVRQFKEGDYVGLVLGDCGEGRQARILGIYAEEVAEKP